MRILCFTIVVIYVLVLVSADYGIETSPNCLSCLNGTKEIVQAIEGVISDTGSVKTCPGLCVEVAVKLKHSIIKHLISCYDVCVDITLTEINNRTNTHFNYAKICESSNHQHCPAEDGTGKLVSAAVTNNPVVSGQDIVIEGVLEADTEIGVADLVFECPLNKTTPMTQLLSPMKMDGWKFTWTVPTTSVSEWKVGNYTCDLLFCSTICNSYPPPKVFGNATLEFTIAKKKTLTV